MNEENYYYEEYLTFFDYVIFVIFVVLPVFLFIKGAVAIAQGMQIIVTSKEDRKAIKEAPYYRDIPCDKDLLKVFLYSKAYNLAARETDLLGAMLLRWLKDKVISVEKREQGVIFKKEEDCIVFKSNSLEADNIRGREIKGEAFMLEQMLYQLMRKASKDGVLEKKEFEKWCSRNYEIILKWFDAVTTTTKETLVQEDKVEARNNGKLFSTTKYIAKEGAITEAMAVSGLKKYLKDYTLIHDRAAIEVELFEEYLMCAQIFGIADKVIKEFKDLYPSVIEDSSFRSYDNVTFLYICSNSGMKSASYARTAAGNYSSGGGGFSSSGGGGGSFGGGGGRWRVKIIYK